MAAEIPISVPSIVQHDVLGELTVDLKQVRERPIYPRGAPEVDVLDGEIRATVQADGAAVRVALCPRLVTDLPRWVDRCATRIMDVIANLDAIKAHVAEHRPDWSEPGDLPVSNLEFAGRLRVLDLNLHDDDTITAFFNDGGLFGGHVFLVSIEEGGKPGDVELAG